ncbi:hypothetical protein EDB19DRAFT_1626954, partial [Suillus lakei]
MADHVEELREALQSCLLSHSDHVTYLINLADSLYNGFEQRSRDAPSELDEAIELQRAALLLCPPGHCERSTSLKYLALSLQKRFQQFRLPPDWDETLTLY